MYKTFINGWGLPGTGKTTFGLTFPGLVWLVQLDRPADVLIKRMNAQVVDLTPNLDSVMTSYAAREFMVVFDDFLSRAIAQGPGLFMVDGGDRLKDIARIVYIEHDKDLKQYSALNEWMTRWMMKVHYSQLQGYITHPYDNVWESATKQSSRIEPDQWRHIDKVTTERLYFFTPGQSREVVPMAIDMEANPTYEPPQARFFTKIQQAKNDATIQGRVIENLTFSLLYELCFEEKYNGGVGK